MPLILATDIIITLLSLVVVGVWIYGYWRLPNAGFLWLITAAVWAGLTRLLIALRVDFVVEWAQQLILPTYVFRIIGAVFVVAAVVAGTSKTKKWK